MQRALLFLVLKIEECTLTNALLSMHLLLQNVAGRFNKKEVVGSENVFNKQNVTLRASLPYKCLVLGWCSWRLWIDLLWSRSEPFEVRISHWGCTGQGLMKKHTLHHHNPHLSFKYTISYTAALGRLVRQAEKSVSFCTALSLSSLKKSNVYVLFL